ncbi:MAG: hypothetical protein KH188_07145 [Prevotella sp.]|nr:hypothetical protein [Prevotella sp.]
MQIEDNTKKMQFFFIVEMQLSLFNEDILAGKDKARKRVVATSDFFRKRHDPTIRTVYSGLITL